MGGCGEPGSGAGVSAEAVADEEGSGELREAQGATVAGVGRGRRESEWKKGGRNCQQCLRGSLPF